MTATQVYQPRRHVDFVGAGPGDAELLTLKALRAFDQADVVLHDRLISDEILKLAGRQAKLVDVGKKGFGPSWKQEDINALLIDFALKGHRVVRLKAGDPGIFGRLDEEIEAIESAGISWRIVPVITAASAAVASMGQSLTRRGRNASLRILTGHDMKGFADHDWSALARPGSVAAIYMGKKSARFIQGRLIMHGADRSTPVTLVENASRPDQRILATTLDRVSHEIAVAKIEGPALMFYGLAPRNAIDALSELNKEHA